MRPGDDEGSSAIERGGDLQRPCRKELCILTWSFTGPPRFVWRACCHTVRRRAPQLTQTWDSSPAQPRRATDGFRRVPWPQTEEGEVVVLWRERGAVTSPNGPLDFDGPSGIVFGFGDGKWGFRGRRCSYFEHDPALAGFLGLCTARRCIEAETAHERPTSEKRP